MTDKIRQKFLLVFLTGVLFLTILAVGIFASRRGGLVTALGPPIALTEQEFTISMPEDWLPVYTSKTPFGSGFWYRRPVRPQDTLDSLTQKTPQRSFIFLSMNPNTPDEQVFAILRQIASHLVKNDNYLYRANVQRPGPGWLDRHNYEHRRGIITFDLHVTRDNRLETIQGLDLVYYQRIKADQRIFLCILVGSTNLTAADAALFEAVTSSFEFIPSDQPFRSPETPEIIRDPEDL
jgi:hypothetical protein